MAEVNFLCVHKNLRLKRLAPVLIKEVTRRVHLEDTWQATSQAPAAEPQEADRRRLLPSRGPDDHKPYHPALQAVGVSGHPGTLEDGAPGRAGGHPPAEGVFQHFAVAPDFDENDVEHWLLPRKDVVDSYLVESPETHEVTDFFSFYTLPSSIISNQNYSVLKAAYSFYNVATKTSWPQLMNDALIVAKQRDYDVFNALDVMENEIFLKELKFGPGDGQLHYYLYNYRMLKMKKKKKGL